MSASSRPLGILAVFVIALVLRLVNVALLQGENAFFAEPDAFTYWALGSALANPAAFWTTLASLTDRMPLYPLFVAGVQSLLGASPRAVAYVQCFLDAGTCALIAALGSLISRPVGLIAGVLAALSPTLIVMCSQILTDSLALLFFTVLLLLAALFLRTPSQPLAAAAGLAGGLTLVTRPALAPLLIAGMPVVVIGAMVHGRRWNAAISSGILFLLFAFAPVLPLVLRNAMVYGSFGLTSQTGDHLAFWIYPLVKQRADGTAYQVSVAEMEARYRERLAMHGSDGDANPFVRSEIKSQIAKEALRKLPGKAFVESWLEGSLVNLAVPGITVDPRMRALPKPSFYGTAGQTLWQRASAYLFEQSGLYQTLLLIGLVASLPMLGLEAAGLMMLARTMPWAALLAAAVLIYFCLLNGPVIGPKYRLPIEPVLLILAAMPIAWIIGRLRARNVAAAA